MLTDGMLIVIVTVSTAGLCLLKSVAAEKEAARLQALVERCPWLAEARQSQLRLERRSLAWLGLALGALAGGVLVWVLL